MRVESHRYLVRLGVGIRVLGGKAEGDEGGGDEDGATPLMRLSRRATETENNNSRPSVVNGGSNS